jgi:small GTP-binding protein
MRSLFLIAATLVMSTSLFLPNPVSHISWVSPRPYLKMSDSDGSSSELPSPSVVNTFSGPSSEAPDTGFKIGEVSDGFRSGFVSIIGNPNVGKSTLMNSMLGQPLCIVSNKPQTTRHRILGVVTDEAQGYQIIFSDTPGMMESPGYLLQEAMMDSVRGAVSDCDVLLLMTDIFGEALVDQKLMENLQKTTRPVLVLINKIDALSLPDQGTAKQTVQATAAASGESTDGTTGTTRLGNKKLTALRQLLRRERAGDTLTVEQKVKLDKHRSALTLALQQRGEGGHEDGLHEVTAEAVDEALDSRQAASEEKDMEVTESHFSSRAVHGTKQPRLSLSQLRERWKALLPDAQIFEMSALRNEGVGDVLGCLAGLMPKGPVYFPPDTLTNRDERFFAAEIIREALFASYRDEIPYSCEIVIDTFRDKSPQLSVIEAVVLCSRESQKKILIGQRAQDVKALSILARSKLEAFLERTVHLTVRVKVEPNWRQSEEALVKFGYKDSDFG